MTEVKGHAEEDMVRRGQVRELDREGKNRADEAADWGRRRVSPHVIDARRNLFGVCERWYPVVRELHRFFIAVSRAVVDDDGVAGIAPHPLVWSAGVLQRCVGLCMLFGMLPCFLGRHPFGILAGSVSLLPQLLRRMSVCGRILLGFLSSLLPFSALCIGLTLVLI